MEMKKEILTLMGMLVVILFISQVAATPETYYYTGDRDQAHRWTGGYCTIPPDQHFKDVPGGTLNYKIWVVEEVANHYGPADMMVQYHKVPLGKSKNELERIEFGKYLYCYTIPDYEWDYELKTNIPNGN